MKEEIWNSMLDADMNVRYWGYLSRRYYVRNKILKIFLAIMASTTVASWSIWVEVEFSWKILSGISALVAIALPILDWDKKIEKLSLLAGKWVQLKYGYEALWIDVKSTQNEENLCKEFKKLHSMEVEINDLESTLPSDKKLLNKCHEEVVLSRGLKVEW